MFFGSKIENETVFIDDERERRRREEVVEKLIVVYEGKRMTL